MEQTLLSVKLPRPTRPDEKHIVIKTHEVERDFYYSPRPVMILKKNPSISAIYAYLATPTSAFYQNQDNPSNDYFYKCLCDLQRQHMEFLGEEPEMYKVPFDDTGFSFKSSKKMLPFTDKKNRLVTYHECIGKKVSIKLRVIPYDFVSKKTQNRIVGLRIVVSGISLV